jgi:hypothetical protein
MVLVLMPTCRLSKFDKNIQPVTGKADQLAALDQCPVAALDLDALLRDLGFEALLFGLIGSQ